MSLSYTSEEATSVLGLIDTYMRWRNYESRGDRKYVYYHPSEFGKCLRYQQYKHYSELGYIKTVQGELGSKLLRLFDKGHNMHNRWTSYFEGMGILKGKWKCANKTCYAFDDKGLFISDINNIVDIINGYKSRVYGNDKLQGIPKPSQCICGCTDFNYLESKVFSDEINMSGHADLILDFNNLDISRFKGVYNSFDNDICSKGIAVVDMKTCNEWKYKKITMSGASADKGYIIQLTIYTHLLDCDYGLLIYECKNNSELVIFKIERNDEIFNTVKWQAKKMIEMASGDSKRLPPPRPLSKTCYECKGCDFLKMCIASNIWKDPKLEIKRKNFYKNLL